MIILLLLLPGAEAFASVPCATIYSRLMRHTERWEISSESSLFQYLDEATAAFRKRVIQVESGLAQKTMSFPRTLTLSESLKTPVVSALLTHTLSKLRGHEAWKEVSTRIDGIPRGGFPWVINLSKKSRQTLEQTVRKAAEAALLRPPQGGFSDALIGDIGELESELLVKMNRFLGLDRDLSVAQESGDNRKVDRITKDLGKLLGPLKYYFAEAARAHIHRQAAFIQRSFLW